MHRRASISALLLAVVALAVAPRPAAASYTVYGCQNWVPYNWSPTELTTYFQCPGIAVRNIGGNFSSGFGAEAGWTFEAPGGTTIAALAMSGQFRGFSGWETVAWSSGAGSGSGYIHEQCPGIAYCPSGVDSLGNYPIQNAAVVRIRVRCTTSSCPNHALNGAADLSLVTVTLNDYMTPTVAIGGGPLASGSWVRGTQSVEVQANDNTGIQALRAYVDGFPRTDQPRPACNWGATLPCPNYGGSIALSTTGLSDGAHRLTVQAVDTGGASSTADETIYVDNVAPSAPQSASIEGGNGWRAANEFAITWTDPSQAAAPITGAVYRFCPSDSTDSSKCVAGFGRPVPRDLKGDQAPGPRARGLVAAALAARRRRQREYVERDPA
jgi:hypothetical protein